MLGKIVHELPPTPENNRNSEGAFITLKNGNILYIYSRFSNKGWADHAEADLYGILSEDGGESFGSPFPVLCHTQVGAGNVMSVSLLRMKNGDIGLFFLAKTGTTLLRCYLTRSPDEGKTWLRYHKFAVHSDTGQPWNQTKRCKPDTHIRQYRCPLQKHTTLLHFPRSQTQKCVLQLAQHAFFIRIYAYRLNSASQFRFVEQL